ncbi:MAG TPA: hybrid sensor histidine kinase/response regulator [Geomonas sp.]|nr:hybrid sensor histidine kinase/response regulator [Geomonas sp.]
MERDEAFQKHLLETFKLEAAEHLQGITSGLIELERSGSAEQRAERVEVVFRESHSLKGAARSVGRGDVESICQAMEGIFSAMKRGEVTPAPDLYDLLQRGADLLGRLLESVGRDASEDEKSSLRELVRALVAARTEKSAAARQPASSAPPEPSSQAVAAEVPPQATQEPAAQAAPAPSPGPAPQPGPAAASVRQEGEPALPTPPKRPTATREPASAASGPRPLPPAGAETVRVSWSKLSAVLLLSEEMLSAKLSARQRALQMRDLRTSFAAWKKQWNKVSPDLQKLAVSPHEVKEPAPEKSYDLRRMADFLSWNSAFVTTLESRLAGQAKAAEHDSRWLGGMVDNLLAEVKKAMMFPFSSLLEAFPKIVRDLSRDSGKEVSLEIRGEEIEIDRRILDEMKDPLIHLVRNSIDHGIENPQEREVKGKPRRGRITIQIAPRDDKAEIVVSDDGAGISPSQLRSALLKLGTLPPEKVHSLSDGELLPFVFQSGLSTSPIITDVSGHGLGLAIVKEKVEKMGGTVSLESGPQRGTLFRLVLPLSVATFRGILVRVADRTFVLPATHVERAVRLKREEIKTVQNRETVTLGDTVVSLERLGAVLELPAPVTELPEQLQAVVVSAAEQIIAFQVDEVLGEQEVLLKSLGPQLARVRNIAGATVLGSGKVAPILNIPDLMKSASGEGKGRVTAAPPGGAAAAPRRRVLVVEDSITSRTLLKNILESAGYGVTTAVDGIDAFTQLKSGQFDVVVSDVDMPRMNGFDLTARIRKDPGLAELPVVLVTALGSREDRERGIDAGANAYIVKSSFDQSNLLEVVKRLC